MTSEPTKPKPRRRWWQYSLRTFFVVLTVLCMCFCWIAWRVHRANEQKKAVEWVEKLGGFVFYDYELDKNGIKIYDPKPPGPKWLVQFLGIHYFQEVSTVSLARPLAILTSLQELYLRHTQVSKEQVEKLQQALPNCAIYWYPPGPSPFHRFLGESSAPPSLGTCGVWPQICLLFPSQRGKCALESRQCRIVA